MSMFDPTPICDEEWRNKLPAPYSDVYEGTSKFPVWIESQIKEAYQRGEAYGRKQAIQDAMTQCSYVSQGAAGEHWKIYMQKVAELLNVK